MQMFFICHHFLGCETAAAARVSKYILCFVEFADVFAFTGFLKLVSGEFCFHKVVGLVGDTDSIKRMIDDPS